jgi:hypothetical protein
MDLRLDYPWATLFQLFQFIRSFHRFPHAETRESTGSRNTECAQDFLGLVFVDLHDFSGARSKG